jgi:hypothetical protein
MIPTPSMPYALHTVVIARRLKNAGQERVSHTVPTDTLPEVETTPARKTCSGCGRQLPLSSFGVNSLRRDGHRSECRDCQRERRGPRGKEAQQAQALERELLALLSTYSTPPLSDVLTRALDEARQIGATGPGFDEQVEAVRRAVLIHGCRRVDEVTEESRLSRWVAARALERLLDEDVLETRDSFLLDDEAAEAGRRVTEYHPKGYPRGEGFSSLFHRGAVDDDLL